MSPAGDISGRLTQRAAAWVLAATTLTAAMELGRMALGLHGGPLVAAFVATALFFPLHLWHLQYGLRGERPPRSAATLAAIAAIQVAALIVVGPLWVYMLSCLATSALIVLRPAWAVPAVVACACGPLLAAAIHPGASTALVPTWQGVITLTFRSMVLFSVVWLVAAVRQLSNARDALAAEAAERERARLRDDLRAALHRSLTALAEATHAARNAIARPGVAAPLVALDRVVERSREALTELRQIVAETRATGHSDAAAGLAITARVSGTPIGRGLTRHTAWAIPSLLHVFAYATCVCTLLGTGYGTHLPWPWVVGVVLASVAALQVPMALDRARRHPSRFGALRLLALTAIATAAFAYNTDMLVMGWFAIAAAAAVLPPRWALAYGAAWVVVTVGNDAIFNPYGQAGWTLAWDSVYVFTAMTIPPVALATTPLLVHLVEDIDDARDKLASEAVNAERRRVSGDLHDVLGQGLTAISLKGDLARRLIETDPAAAARELDELTRLADGQADEIESVARGEREIAFATEIRDAVALLRTADIAVDADVELEELEGDTSTLLGHAVREGATNVLRHAHAKRVRLRAGRDDGAVWFELVNDGAGGRRGDGTGLVALSDRAEAARGSIQAGPSGHGTFTLRVSIPERVAVAS